MKLEQEPLFRMYQLTIDPDKKADFVQVGFNNLMTSYRNELGTLAMYATHADEAGAKNFVFELYRDAKSYDVHAQSPQFHTYQQVAGNTVLEHKMVELKPFLIETSADPITISGKNDYQIQLTETTVPSTELQEFKENLEKLWQKKNATSSWFAASLIDDETKWLLLEVYPQSIQPVLTQDAKLNNQNMQNKVLFCDTLVNRNAIKFQNI